MSAKPIVLYNAHIETHFRSQKLIGGRVGVICSGSVLWVGKIIFIDEVWTRVEDRRSDVMAHFHGDLTPEEAFLAFFNRFNP